MIHFLTKKEVIDIITNDYDHYYQTFFKIDLQVRKVNSIEEYKIKSKDSASYFTSLEKQKIINHIKWIDQKLKVNIDWKIGCIKGSYEEGLPHTRKAKDGSIVILLSKQDINKDTLCHEKIHVYQKMYKKKTLLYLQQFKKIGRRKKGIRANPDINSYVYEGFGSYYVSNPISIQDVEFNDEKEHPLEKMCYDMTNLIIS